MAVVTKVVQNEDGDLCLVMEEGPPCVLTDEAYDNLWFSDIQADALAEALDVPIERS